MCELYKIENIKGKMRSKFPESFICFFYDYNNLKNYISNLDNILDNIFDMVSLLYSNKDKFALYIRLHGYKQWIMIRITLNNLELSDIKDYLKTTLSNDNLYNIDIHNNKIIIAISKSIE